MRGTIRDRLSSNGEVHIFGRDTELGVLRRAITQGAPVVVHVHGLSGIGKSALLNAFGREAAYGGATVLMVDCNLVEPTERGFLNELGRALDCPPTLERVAAMLALRPAPVLLILDAYEKLGLLDSWLRSRCIPMLPERSFIVLGSKLPPSRAWTERPEWRGLIKPLPLGYLSDSAAAAMLSHAGVNDEVAARIRIFAAGHPLALMLAAEAASSVQGNGVAAEPIEAVIPNLARRYLNDISDLETRDALQRACVARRITCGLLRAIQPDGDAASLYERLSALPFATITRDGIAIHEAVRESLNCDLRAADPELHRSCREAAWYYLFHEAREAPAAQLWRLTADLIYLIQNTIVREAFFPHDVADLTFEPARPADFAEILNIAEMHDHRGGLDLIRLWAELVPHAFYVAVIGRREICGFYCLLDAAEVPMALRSKDPIVARFCKDLDERPVNKGESTLFLRRWLCRVEGEQPCAVQAACWLDIKRHYMELRPRLRRVYMALSDPHLYWPVARNLGISTLSDPIPLGNTVQTALLLDMGVGSVDGWLLRLAADELGIASPPRAALDRSKRALNFDGRFVPLTRREFTVLDYLVERPGQLVLRDDLIKDVWGLRFAPGSNVVDAVVASLRRKLGSQSGLIETVRGFGYSYRSDNKIQAADM